MKRGVYIWKNHHFQIGEMDGTKNLKKRRKEKKNVTDWYCMWKTFCWYNKSFYISFELKHHKHQAPTPSHRIGSERIIFVFLLLFYCKYQVQIVFSLVFPFEYITDDMCVLWKVMPACIVYADRVLCKHVNYLY